MNKYAKGFAMPNLDFILSAMYKAYEIVDS